MVIFLKPPPPISPLIVTVSVALIVRLSRSPTPSPEIFQPPSKVKLPTTSKVTSPVRVTLPPKVTLSLFSTGPSATTFPYCCFPLILPEREANTES